MLRVYACITQEHDLRFVVVAGVICLLSSFVTFAAFEQAQSDNARKWLWTALTALVAGLGIWSTHFVAMLAYEPELPVGYDIATTMLSVGAAIVVTGLGWATALARHRALAIVGGAIVGAGVGTMHYIGMAAVEIAGLIVWDRPMAITSVAMGMVLAAAATGCHRLAPPNVARFAPVLLTLAICALHFTAMAAVSIYPSNAVAMPTSSIDSATLAIAITAGILVIFGVGFGVILHERRLARARLAEAEQRAAMADEILRNAAEREALTAQLEHEAAISSAALESMAQGLSMYDADYRLVTFNRRYAELYGLSEEMLVPGVASSQILAHLVSTGMVPGTVAQYQQALRTAARAGGHTEVELRDGRIIEVRLRETPSNGWGGDARGRDRQAPRG